MNYIPDFRFWCQKVLPSVFDDSLSYYELLGKVVNYLNECVGQVNVNTKEVEQLSKQVATLQESIKPLAEKEARAYVDGLIASGDIITPDTLPVKLPNPQPIIIDGKSYDGSEKVEIELPDNVTSVNGFTGTVTLTASDVGAIANVIGSVKTNNIADGAVTSNKIADDSITANAIVAKNVTTEALADGAVTLGKIANQGADNSGKSLVVGSNGTVTLADVGGGGSGGGNVVSVNGKDGVVVLAASDVGALSDADGAVATVNIADGAITRGKLANGAAGTNEINFGDDKTGYMIITQKGHPYLFNPATNLVMSIGGKSGELTLADIGALPNIDGAIDNPDLLEANVVTTEKIADSNVTLAKIGGIDTANAGKVLVVSDTGGVNVADLPSGGGKVDSVNGKEGVVVLAASDVGAIANTDGAVTNSNIADEAVETAKIKNANVTLEKIGGIAPGNAGKVLVVSGSGGVGVADMPTSDVVSVNGKTGAVVLTAGDVNALPNEDGIIDAQLLDSNSVTPDKIVTGAVTAAKIADGSVSTNKLEQKCVTVQKMADDALTPTVNIATGSVASGDINGRIGRLSVANLTINIDTASSEGHSFVLVNAGTSDCTVTLSGGTPLGDSKSTFTLKPGGCAGVIPGGLGKYATVGV